MIGFEDACLDAPVGVALIAALEARERSRDTWFQTASKSSLDGVAAAVQSVHEMSFGELCAVTVFVVNSLVGPWSVDTPRWAAAAYRGAESRRAIAAAITQRFDSELHATMDAGRQQWWTAALYPDRPVTPQQQFEDYDDIYGNGEFIRRGVWTATDPPHEAHDELVCAWEMADGSISRWHLPVHKNARVFEVHRPDDWLALVQVHSVVSTPSDRAWEFSGPSRALRRTGLMDVPQQRAAAREPSRVIVPDWVSVAKTYDAVHVSWAGIITAEGYVTNVADSLVTMLRYWFSERTHWLRDSFEEPTPLAAPLLGGALNGICGVNVLLDGSRRQTDYRALLRVLGRTTRAGGASPLG